MRRRTFSLIRRFLPSFSCLKERILQNTQSHVAQPRLGLSTLSPQLRNVTSEGGGSLVIPSLMSNPVWRENIVKPQSTAQSEALKYIIHPKLPFYNPSLMTSSRKEFQEKPPTWKIADAQPSLKECLMDEVQAPLPGNHKVTVVGAGCVGIACAVCVLQQQVTNQLCMVDVAKDKVSGEIMDLEHGSSFMRHLDLEASADYEASTGSKVCIVAAGVRRQNVNQSRLELLGKNVEIIKSVIPALVRYSPDAIFIIASNPVDILTHVSWKLSGLPMGRVFGCGCELDTSRFRVFIAERIGVAPASCHGWIIGEHGDSSVPVWSGVNVAGVRFMDLNPCIGTPQDPEDWGAVHRKVVTCAAEVLRLKGHTAWAIAMTCAALTYTVLYNVGTVHSVTLHAQGYHCIKDEVFLSLPASIGINGVNSVIKQNLIDTEIDELHKSAKILKSKQDSIKY